jgi:GH24 family phage-related lysozyme (muramidase)
MNMYNEKLVSPYLGDIREAESYREFAYPDPLSGLARKYRHLPWGFKPARDLLNLIGEDESKGNPWTVGYGHTHGVNPDTRFSKEMAEHKLKEMAWDALITANKLVPNFYEHPEEIRRVLVDMAYNLGYNKLAKFKNTLRACREFRYEDMAKGMENSLWYKQVGTRAKKLVNLVRQHVKET